MILLAEGDDVGASWTMTSSPGPISMPSSSTWACRLSEVCSMSTVQGTSMVWRPISHVASSRRSPVVSSRANAAALVGPNDAELDALAGRGILEREPAVGPARQAERRLGADALQLALAARPRSTPRTKPLVPGDSTSTTLPLSAS